MVEGYVLRVEGERQTAIVIPARVEELLVARSHPVHV
jgi:hypothetical protein